MQHKSLSRQLQQIASSYDFHPFGQLLRPLIDEALKESGKNLFRKGTTLIPTFLIRVVLAMTLRRDLNTQAVIGWMISGTRWIDLNLPTKLLSDGALSHARAALGFEVFRLIFNKFSAKVERSPDFHGLTTMIFDGTTLTMPDTEKNGAEFGKHTSQHGPAGFGATADGRLDGRRHSPGARSGLRSLSRQRDGRTIIDERDSHTPELEMLPPAL